MRIGYSLLSEEHPPLELVENGRRAEQAGCEFITISDHYHPWIEAQGQSPLVWSVIGGLALATERAEIITFVTCPTFRIHPTIIAQAGATAAAMLPGRFRLGVGSGEALNEHILGEHWPPPGERLDRLDEAIDIIRELWNGEQLTYHGAYYTVEDARVYTLPQELPPILVAATGPTSIALAAKNDGLITVIPDSSLIEQFHQKAGASKPAYGQLTLSYAEDMDTARRNAREHWPQATLPPDVLWELRSPALFERFAEKVSDEAAGKTVLATTNADDIISALGSYADAGFDSVGLHQVGPEQGRFLDLVEEQVIPGFRAKYG